MGIAFSSLSDMLWLAGGLIAAYMLFISIRPDWMWKLRKLPGPRRLPLLGCLPDILAHGTMAVWLQEQADKYGPVYQLWNGAEPSVVVTDPDLARKILINNPTRPDLGFFTTVEGMEYAVAENVLINIDGHSTKFKTLRKAFESAVLVPSAMEQQTSMLLEITARIIRHLSRYATTGEPVDVTKCMADMTIDAIGNAAFGLDFDCMGQSGRSQDTDINTSQKWIDAPLGSVAFTKGLTETIRVMVHLTDVAYGTPWRVFGLLLPSWSSVTRFIANRLPDAKLKAEVQARRDTNYVVQRMMDEWRTYKQTMAADGGAADKNLHKPAMSEKGFVSRLLAAQQSEGLTEVDIIASALIMLLAGYETTASVLSSALYSLAANPEVQAKAQQEVDAVLQGKEVTPEDLDRLPYIRGVFEEALRLYTPADCVLRKPKNRVDIGNGQFIPAGTFVWMSVYTMQRSPKFWPRATEFLPERHIQPGNEHLAPSNPNAFMPFGQGIRMCPGYKFARVEGRLALARMVQAFHFKPAPGKPVPEYSSGIVYSPKFVWLTIESRKSKSSQ